jgi:imidazolonepropionase-like amidohydrolase
MHAIRAAHAFDGERFLPGGATVLVEGERILGVEGGEADLPHDCEVASYDGTLLPGLFDAHVHLVADSTFGSLERSADEEPDRVDATIAATLALQAASGVTTIRDLGDVGYRTLAFRDRADPGVPRIVAAGPPLTVPDGHCHYLGGAVHGADSVRAAVAEHVERGVDVLKVMASGGMTTTGTDVTGVQFSAEDLRLVVEAAHEGGLRVLAHAHSQAGAWHAVRAGVDGLEHFTCLTDAGIRTPDDLLEAIAAAGIEVDPTLGTDPARVPPLEQLPPNIRATVERLGVHPGRLVEARMEQLSAVRAHGIRVVTGVDAGVSPPKLHGSAWLAVAQLTEAGFPVAEALATATSVAAEACGLADATGRLAPGLAADLLVVDGNLERDVGALGRPLAVLVRGDQPLT